MGKNTLLLIKPNATKRHLVGEIIKILEENKFLIQHLKSFNMSDELAAEFYAEHAEREFFPELVRFMQSGIIIGIVLQKENAIEDLRKLVGKTNPSQAEIGTLRYMFGESVRFNAVHASDSPEAARREIKLVFPDI